MYKESIGRREFIGTGAKAALVLSLPALGGLSCGRAAVAKKEEAEVPSRIVMVGDKEPGEPLIMSGRIFTPDGARPLSGINLYVYQTDVTGRYTTSGGDNRNTRLHGLMRTDTAGRYEFRTIKPGSYPQTRNPSHIHAYVSGPGYPEYWIDEYLFDDDPFVLEEVRQRYKDMGAFSPIIKLTRSSEGVLRGTRDMKIERCSKNCTGRGES